jgi:hypothetical protein
MIPSLRAAIECRGALLVHRALIAVRSGLSEPLVLLAHWDSRAVRDLHMPLLVIHGRAAYSPQAQRDNPAASLSCEAGAATSASTR